ncbi:MAG: hypothetical protein HQL69_00830 [Magnetococcales bacterium]|nr:hypothetical protein [Magnetococcales bacterium]
MEKTAVKAEVKTQRDAGCNWTLIISAGITTATLLFLMHMHQFITQTIAT